MKYKIIYKDIFPEKLKKIKKPPEKLYAIGNINLLYEKCFAIVGTRRISKYGIKNCEYFTKELVLRNIPIVSGMAIGTDTIAHKTALEYKGSTIAVLGSGFNNIYPESNLELFKKIIDNNGLILTEYDKNIKPLKENFPNRNRIVTALSEGILVIEAAYRSGTSITARNAREQGKNVFAIPGKLDSELGIGVNRLIREGAILTTCVEDILEYYDDFKKREKITLVEKRVFIKKEYRKLFYFIKEKPRNLEEILIKMKMDLQEVVSLVTNMEIEGLIYQDISGRFNCL